MVRNAETAQADARQAVIELRGQRDQLTALRGQMERAERDLADLRSGMGGAQARLTGFETILARRDEIEAGWKALVAAREQDGAFNAGLREYSRLQEQRSHVERAIDQARVELVSERRRLVARMDDLKRKATAAQQQAAVLEEALTILAEMGVQQARREVIATERQDISERLAARRVELERLKVEGQAVREKIEMMGTAEAATCPLCRQPLTPEHHDLMLADLEAERTALADRYAAGQTEHKTLAGLRSALEAEDAELAGQLRPRDARQRQAAQAERIVAEGAEAVAEHQTVAVELEALEARLAAEDYAGDVRAALAELQAQIAGLNYDSAAHTEACAASGTPDLLRRGISAPVTARDRGRGGSTRSGRDPGGPTRTPRGGACR